MYRNHWTSTSAGAHTCSNFHINNGLLLQAHACALSNVPYVQRAAGRCPAFYDAFINLLHCDAVKSVRMTSVWINFSSTNTFACRLQTFQEVYVLYEFAQNSLHTHAHMYLWNYESSMLYAQRHAIKNGMHKI